MAGSVVFLGLAARLISPPLGAAVLTGVVPCLAVGDLWWRPARGGPWPMAAGPAGARRVGGLSSASQLSDAAALLAEHSVRGGIEPVAGTLAAAFRVSPLVLRGNIASALAGAAGRVAGPARVGAEMVVMMSLLQGSCVPKQWGVVMAECLTHRPPPGGPSCR